MRSRGRSQLSFSRTDATLRTRRQQLLALRPLLTGQKLPVEKNIADGRSHLAAVSRDDSLHSRQEKLVVPILCSTRADRSTPETAHCINGRRNSITRDRASLVASASNASQWP